MNPILSRILSPTVLLYAYIVISNFFVGIYGGMGIYGGVQSEPPAIVTTLDWAVFLWIFGWWLHNDSRKRGVAQIYDLGLFLMVAWPIVLPFHLIKTRGAQGLLFILAFIGVALAAFVLGAIVAVTISVW